MEASKSEKKKRRKKKKEKRINFLTNKDRYSAIKNVRTYLFYFLTLQDFGRLATTCRQLFWEVKFHPWYKHLWHQTVPAFPHQIRSFLCMAHDAKTTDQLLEVRKTVTDLAKKSTQATYHDFRRRHYMTPYEFLQDFFKRIRGYLRPGYNRLQPGQYIEIAHFSDAGQPKDGAAALRCASEEYIRYSDNVRWLPHEAWVPTKYCQRVKGMITPDVKLAMELCGIRLCAGWMDYT